MPPREALNIRQQGVQSGYELLRGLGRSIEGASESLSRAGTLERLRAMDKARLEMERVGLEKEFRRQEAQKIAGEMKASGYMHGANGEPFNPATDDPTQYRMGQPVFMQKQAHADVNAIPEDALQDYKPPTEFHQDAWIKRLGVMTAQGALQEKAEEKKKVEDTSKSIVAATSLEELDRVDPMGVPTLGVAVERKRKVLKEEQDRRLGEALSGYTGGIEGLEEFFEKGEFKPTPAEVARAQEIVFRRQSYDRAKVDMDAAEEARKTGKVKDAAGLYMKSQASLNAQIDDIEKKGVVEERNIATGAITRSFDPTRLSGADQTLLVRLKADRLKAVDALSDMAAAGATLSDADLAAEAIRIAEMIKARKAGK